MQRSIQLIHEIIEPLRSESNAPEGLSENIKKYGILHPVLVTPDGKLLCGSRRLQAAKQVGLTEIPVTEINPASELDELDIQLSENCQRREFSILELSQAVFKRKKLWEEKYGRIHPGGDFSSNEINGSDSILQLSQNVPPNFYEETGQLLGKGTRWVYDLLKLNGLDDDLKEQINNDAKSYKDALREQGARALARSPSKSNRKKNQTQNKLSGLFTPEKLKQLNLQLQHIPNLLYLCNLTKNYLDEIKKLGDISPELLKADMDILDTTHNLLSELAQYLQQLASLIADRQESQISNSQI